MVLWRIALVEGAMPKGLKLSGSCTEKVAFLYREMGVFPILRGDDGAEGNSVD